MAKISARKKNNVASEQEELLRELKKKDKKKNTQRVTIDFPSFIYDQIKNETEETGQTIKGFMVMLVRDYFNKKNIT